MQKTETTARPTTLGELVRVLSLVMEDEAQVARTLKAMAESGMVRSESAGRPRIRVVSAP